MRKMILSFNYDKPELFEYIDLRTKYKNKRIEHDFSHISSKDICIC